MNRCKAHAASVLMLVAMVGREPEAIRSHEPWRMGTLAPTRPFNDGCQGHIR